MIIFGFILFWNLFFIDRYLFYEVNLSASSLRTFQSDTISNRRSSFAIDRDFSSCSIAGSDVATTNSAWWRMELDKTYSIVRVIIVNSPSTSYHNFLNYLNIYVSRDDQSFGRHLCASVDSKPNISNGILSLECQESIPGKFVTITRYGGFKPNMLVLCEVSIHFSTDIAANSYATNPSQSGILFTETSSYAVDGNNDTCTRVYAGENENAWWRLTLDDVFDIESISIFYKLSIFDALSLNNFSVYISNDEEDYHQKLCATFYDLTDVHAGAIKLNCRKVVSGNYVTISKFQGFRTSSLLFCEVVLFGPGATDKNCLNEEIRCEVLSKCLPKELICDAIIQCPDGSDELNCNCSHFQYKCREGRCITKDWLCDGIKDCPNGDDEETTCTLCQKSKFKCIKNNRCIISLKRCDGFMDCQDFSDEQGCLEFNVLNNKVGPLKATFRGETEYNICSKRWMAKHSFHACKEMGFGLHRAFKFVKLINVSKIITLKPIKDLSLPFMMLFEKSVHCSSKEFVKLNCHTLSQEECGTREIPDNDFGPHIVNGARAKPGAWPWYVQLIGGGRFKCGASLIRNDLVLTAAHCLYGVTNASEIFVKVGTNVRDDPMVKSHSISQIIIHPSYVPQNLSYDAALIKLKNPILFSNTVRKICLPNKNWSLKKLKSFKYCVIMGLGLLDEGAHFTKHLMQGRMNVMSLKECIENLVNVTQRSPEYFVNYLTNTTYFCAGSFPTDIGVNMCRGDSGGPLVCKNEHGTWTQVGIMRSFMTSRNNVKCQSTLFTKIDSVLMFIQSHLLN